MQFARCTSTSIAFGELFRGKKVIISLVGFLVSGRVIPSLDVISFHTLRIPHRFSDGPVPSAATRAVSSGGGGSFGKGHYGASSLSVCNYAFAASTSATVCFVCGVTLNTKIKTLMLDILLTLFIDACFTFKNKEIRDFW